VLFLGVDFFFLVFFFHIPQPRGLRVFRDLDSRLNPLLSLDGGLGTPTFFFLNVLNELCFCWIVSLFFFPWGFFLGGGGSKGLWAFWVVFHNVFLVFAMLFGCAWVFQFRVFFFFPFGLSVSVVVRMAHVPPGRIPVLVPD